MAHVFFISLYSSSTGIDKGRLHHPIVHATLSNPKCKKPKLCPKSNYKMSPANAIKPMDKPKCDHTLQIETTILHSLSQSKENK